MQAYPDGLTKLENVHRQTSVRVAQGHTRSQALPLAGIGHVCDPPSVAKRFPCGPAVSALALSLRDCARQYWRARPSLAPQKSATAYEARRARRNLLTSLFLIVRRLPHKKRRCGSVDLKRLAVVNARVNGQARAVRPATLISGQPHDTTQGHSFLEGRRHIGRARRG